MNKITRIFSEPYPLEDDPKTQLIYSVGISVFVVAFLLVFQPFGLSGVNLPLVKLFAVYVGYGLVTLIVTLLCDRLIRPAFPKFFNEVEWTVSKNIIWLVIVIMLIGLGNLFYSNILGFTGISGSTLLTFQVYTMTVAVIPVTILTLIRTITLLKLNLNRAKAINENLSKPLSEASPESLLVFNSENLKDEIKLSANQFLFAESSDNYTDIVYIENGIVKRALIRSSLKRIEDMNTSAFIIRTHRAYLVNLRKVKKVEGNSQGYRLVFENVDETVPVARRSSSLVKDLLSRIHS